jgi:hypothetical protein
LLIPYIDSYDGISSETYPFPSPPAPAPGQQLLDPEESNFLNSFFDGVSSDHFNDSFFSTDGGGMDNMGYGWQDLPPSFMGTVAPSFGQQPMITPNDTALSSMLFPDMSSSMGIASNSLQTTEADVAAAASLLQNGHVHNNLGHHLPSPSLFSNGANQMTSSELVSQSRDQLVQYDQDKPRSQGPKDDGHTYFADLMFGYATSTAASGRSRPKLPKNADIRWGSDEGFGSGQGFVAPANQKSLASIELGAMEVLGQLEPAISTAASTRPSSPVVSRHVEPLSRRPGTFSNGLHYRDEDEESRPLKRRKSSKMRLKEEDDDEDDDEDEEDSMSRPLNKKRRHKSMVTARRSSSANTTQSPPPSKRRKSAADSAAKASRENLTEDQKRENHIKSEQKRRTLIKEGFDDLGELVPDLRGGGHSKSAVLIMAADWLEDLKKGNEILMERLRVIESTQGI